MLDDEEHFIMVLWLGEGPLLREQTIEAEVAGIAHPIAEIRNDAGFKRPLILF